jgi:ATP-dependent Clp protease adapter protein ClpS
MRKPLAKWSITLYDSKYHRKDAIEFMIEYCLGLSKTIASTVSNNLQSQGQAILAIGHLEYIEHLRDRVKHFSRACDHEEQERPIRVEIASI